MMNYIQPVTTVFSAILGSLGVFGALYYVHKKSDDRWAALKTETDNRWASLLTAFTDFKNVTVERLTALENPKRDE